MDIERPPRLDDFGLSEELVSQLPEPYVAGHRPRILAAGLAVAVAASVAVAAALTGSLAAAVIFGGLLLCAASVLLLPAAVALLCAAEAVEDRWLCRRLEAYRNLTAFRSALAAHQDAERQAAAARHERLQRWRSMGADELCDAVAEVLDRQGWQVERVPAVLESGVDLRIERDGRSVVVKCTPGSRPPGPSLVRELVTSCADFAVDGALLVAPAGRTCRLDDALQGRPVTLVDAEQLAAAEQGAPMPLAGGPSPSGV